MKRPPQHIFDEMRRDYRTATSSQRAGLCREWASSLGVSESTVRRWLGPVDGRKPRRDAGGIRVDVDEETLSRLCELYKDGMSAGEIIRYAETKGWISSGAISAKTLSRILDTPLAVPAPKNFSSDDDVSLRDWCAERIMIRGKPWSLDRHEYLEEIYDALESCLDIVFRKAAQVGLSTAVLLSAIRECDVRGAKCLYYLSTDADAEDFSADRIDSMIDESEYLEGIVGRRAGRSRAHDSMGLRHVGPGSLYCRGMYTRRKVKSVDGDILFLDELDEADQENREFALDRVLHSDIQFVRELSQPSVPNYGIDASFAHCDQRHWHLICPSCKRLTCLELDLDQEEELPVPRAIISVPEGASWAKPGQKYYRACVHCLHPLDMSMGKWVAMQPGQHKRGYHVSGLYTQICSPNHADPADAIMEKVRDARDRKKRARVLISIYGFPYGGGKNAITDKILDNAQGTHGFLSKSSGTYIGIDQGDVMHVVVLSPQDRVLAFFIADDWAEIPEMFDRYGVRSAVCDALPEKSQAKTAMRQIPEFQGYICYFQGEEFQKGFEDDVPKISIDRTEAIDETVRKLCEGEIAFPDPEKMDDKSLAIYEGEFRPHLKMLKRRLTENARGVSRWEYLRSVPNHFGLPGADVCVISAYGTSLY